MMPQLASQPINESNIYDCVDQSEHFLESKLFAYPIRRWPSLL